MKLGKWRNNDAPVRTSKKTKEELEKTISELIKRGYTVTFRHPKIHAAELRKMQ